jgi:hypothetical protein
MNRLWLFGVSGSCLMSFGAFQQWLDRGSRVTLLDVQWRPWPTMNTYFGSPGSGSAALHNFGWALFAVGAVLDAIAIVVLLRRGKVARGVTGEALGNT